MIRRVRYANFFWLWFDSNRLPDPSNRIPIFFFGDSICDSITWEAFFRDLRYNFLKKQEGKPSKAETKYNRWNTENTENTKIIKAHWFTSMKLF